MKNKIILIVQILVSVLILAYLFNSIFERESSTELKPLTALQTTAADMAANPGLTVSQIEVIRTLQLSQFAKTFGLTVPQIALIRDRCIVTIPNEESSINLKLLPLGERLPIVWKIGPHGLGKVFASLSMGWFAASILCMGLVCLLGITRWRLIMHVQGLEISFSRATSIFFIGQFFNAFMLGATGGDVIKAWYVAHETRHKKAEAVISVVVDRIIGLLALFVIALLMMAIFYKRVFQDQRLVWISLFTLLFVMATVVATILVFWKGFADKIPGLRGWLKRLPKYDTLERMVYAARVYAAHPSVIVNTMLQSFAVHIFSMLAIYCIAKGLAITAGDIVDYFLYLPIINTLSAVPISFSGFGVREGMYVKLFSQVNMPEVQALALSLLGYIVGLFWSIVGGGFFLTHRKELPPASSMDKEE